VETDSSAAGTTWGGFPKLETSRFDIQHAQSLSRQAFLNHSPVKVGQRKIMLLPELPSPLRVVRAAKDLDVLRLHGWQEPVSIGSSVRDTSKSPVRVSLLCNIALSIALIFALFVSIRQNDTIKGQRQNIFEMSQNPYCTGAPGFRGKSAASPALPSGPVVQDN
jgi:hypothetical protein